LPVKLVKVPPKVERYPEYEELDWVVGFAPA